MVNFTKENVTEHIDRIRGLGDVCMYFIHGEKKGLLIDTAYGVGDLKGFIEKTYPMPYEVVITHGHADHANGISQWPYVYMNHLDIDLYYSRSAISLRKDMLRKHNPEIDQLPENDFQVPFTGEFKELSDGMVFDLGNVHVRAIHAPGHTAGMTALLVYEDRICIFGDACGVCTFLFRPEASTVLEYKNTLNKLKSFAKDYDRILRMHGTCESDMNLVDENLETADQILNHEDDAIPFDYMGFHAYMAHPYDPDHGNIVYDQNRIR